MVFKNYLFLWNLIEDGEPIFTKTSELLPVQFQNQPAMLKIARCSEEQRGNKLMCWWEGMGAPRVFLHDEQTILMERATGTRSLVNMVHDNKDDEASEIICAVAKTLHAHKKNPPSELISLSIWFESLNQASVREGGIFLRAKRVSDELLKTPQDEAVLHGDLHHQNVLDFNERGFLAIDPKGIVGERGFDFANIFCNPDQQSAHNKNRFLQRLNVVSRCAAIEKNRLLQWIFVYSALSAAWSIEEGESPELALQIAEFADQC